MLDELDDGMGDRLIAARLWLQNAQLSLNTHPQYREREGELESLMADLEAAIHKIGTLLSGFEIKSLEEIKG